MIIAITGQTGYLGSSLAKSLEAQGHSIVPLTRKGTPSFQLDGPPPPPEWFREQKIDALIHCAYDFASVRWEDIHRNNVLGSIRLFESAAAGGVKRLLFVSSMSAYAGCRSLYGRAKLEVEQAVLGLGGWVLRPGLIIDRDPAGIVGKMLKVIAISPVLPLIGDGRQILYVTHPLDLAKLMNRVLASGEAPPREAITTANPEPWEFRKILSVLASARGRNPRFFPLPWRFLWLTIKTLETVGISIGFRSDSVVSLIYQNPHPKFSDSLTEFRNLSEMVSS